MVYGLGDVVSLGQMIAQSDASEARKRLERGKLDALLGYCESTRCRREVLLGYFSETYTGPCGHCDNCLDPPECFDGTELAQMALSAVYRCGQRFGAAHVIDVLRGSASERLRELGHDRLSVYGVGARLDTAAWRSVIRQLVAGGWLDVDWEGYGTLRLTEASREVLRGAQRVELRREAPAREARTRATRGGRDAAPAPVLQGEAVARFTALRDWRLDTARAQGVPAYTIFHDATLLAIAQRAPESLDALARLPGIGTHKLERYGEAVLALLRDGG